MNFLIFGRIGPMEEGARAGTFLEAGEIVSADIFRAESIPLLVEAGLIAETDLGVSVAPVNDSEIVVEQYRDAEGQFTADASEDADGKTETIRRKRAKREEN